MIRISDYKKSNFTVDEIKLSFNLFEHETLVESWTAYRRTGEGNLFLQGEHLDLIEIRLNGRLLGSKDFSHHHLGIEIFNPPEVFQLEIKHHLFPQKNTSLEGLYYSRGIFCTQCEPQAFRQITYFLDRPDIMTRYTVSIEADALKFPVLLSNGNLIAEEKLPQGRHRKVWMDPTLKPSYLFALVAGHLGRVEDRFVTRSGRSVLLEVYVNPGNESQCQFALESLKHAMKWDEDVFGLEYELDRYMIVAIDDFNSGAMENKGLNIFNSKYVLASSESATDEDYEMIESVVAHEYFHNYSGNRVTLRDWFYLSLKEGLTVFRDQEFSADRRGRALVRIQDVEVLQSRQFTEDAGPQAHPVLPKQGMAMDNLFSMTIYEKGAEVIRMIQTILGRNKFREILKSYFKKFDGQAITIMDFVDHFEQESGFNFRQFKNWYHLAGTPWVQVQEKEISGQKHLELSQKNPLHPACPLVIPLRVEGAALPGALTNSDGEQVYLLRREKEVLELPRDMKSHSLEWMHGFSAPIHFKNDQSPSEVIQSLFSTRDEVNLVQKSQSVLQHLMTEIYEGREPEVLSGFIEALSKRLGASDLSLGIKAKLLEPLSPSIWIQQRSEVDFAQVLFAKKTLSHLLARSLRPTLLDVWEKFSKKNLDSTYSPHLAEERSFVFALSQLLIEVEPDHVYSLLVQKARQGRNMTEVLRSMKILTEHFPKDAAVDSLHQEFYEKWKSSQLILTKWLKIQCMIPQKESFARLKSLLHHPSYDQKNPNTVYSTLWTFGENFLAFHHPDLYSEVYPMYVQKMSEIDTVNPQVAARLAGAFNMNRFLRGTQRENLLTCLEKWPESNWSVNTREKIQTALKELRTKPDEKSWYSMISPSK